jgi:hypothetical protein
MLMVCTRYGMWLASLIATAWHWIANSRVGISIATLLVEKRGSETVKEKAIPLLHLTVPSSVTCKRGLAQGKI